MRNKGVSAPIGASHIDVVESYVDGRVRSFDRRARRDHLDRVDQHVFDLRFPGVPAAGFGTSHGAPHPAVRADGQSTVGHHLAVRCHRNEFQRQQGILGEKRRRCEKSGIIFPCVKQDGSAAGNDLARGRRDIGLEHQRRRSANVPHVHRMPHAENSLVVERAFAGRKQPAVCIAGVGGEPAEIFEPVSFMTGGSPIGA